MISVRMKCWNVYLYSIGYLMLGLESEHRSNQSKLSERLKALNGRHVQRGTDKMYTAIRQEQSVGAITA